MSALDLAIETSTPIGSIALASRGALVGEAVLDEHTRHAEALLPALEQLLNRCGASARDIARIAVGGGPGSFTGLRIAAASAKGLVHALGARLYAYSGLLVSAAGCAAPGQQVCVLFDARRSEVYAACYSIAAEIETVLAPSVWHLQELLAELSPQGRMFAGDGAVKHAGAIRARGGVVLPAEAGVPRANQLLALLGKYPDLGFVESPARWEPQYLRASSAERGISA